MFAACPPGAPFTNLWINTAWINKHIHYKVWNEITYQFPNVNDATVEVWEWISNSIPGHVSSSMPELKLIRVSKMGYKASFIKSG